ncbi:MAG TPA: 30S ribosomal protein S1 [Candidatus Dependentiae bacterium]|nr:30S ribosomal protein S1 [Candidatus Dependentiae bacterium]HRQ63149.1 30S ribosomal protein S1 [Candidatus Dependentiae bacterium]
MSKEHIYPSQFRTIKSKQNFDTTSLELSDEQKQALLSLYEEVDSFHPGNVVAGTIIAVDSDGVLVDIGYKSHGLIPKYEFGEHELRGLKPAQAIEVILDNLEDAQGNLVLSYEKAKAAKAWKKITELFEANKPVEGIVTHKVKGGLSVDIGIGAFLPGSQIDLQRVTDFDQYVGQTITANILKINQKRGNVIISRRKFLGDQRSEARKEILGTLKIGDIIPGIVKNITNYGVFIDIGGVDGLLHITDMTWGRISHPSEMVKLGQNIAVKVLSFDKDNEKISLGLKQLTENPWAQVVDNIQVGSRIKGKISSITDYGLFVEVAPNVEGLVHISEVSWTDRITNLSDKYKVGNVIDVLVVSMDKENRRMSLSIKQLEQNPWEAVDQTFKIGQKIKGTISNITDFGIFVQLLPGIDGLVHISDLSWTEHIEHPSDRYKIGQEVEAAVLAIDKNSKKISLGIKQLDQDPWDNVEQEYQVGKVIEGEVSKITNFGAFVKLPTGIEGLLHNANIAEGKKAEDVLKVGDKAQFRVINVNKGERKIGLDMRLEADAPKPKHTTAKERAPRADKESMHKAMGDQPKTKSAFQIALESAMKKDDESSEQ